MARKLTKPTQFAELHKQKKFTDACTLTGTGLQVGDIVTVTGTLGTQKTQWKGTITQKNEGGTFDCNDLHVRQLQTGNPDPPPATEDVKVKVSDPDSSDESNEETTAGVMISNDPAVRPVFKRVIPHVTSVTFPGGLHLQSGFQDTAQLTGTGMAVGNPVDVYGQTTGTHWHGTITKATSTSAATNNLRVVPPGTHRPVEDVSTTVSNSDGASNPVITKNVPEVP